MRKSVPDDTSSSETTTCLQNRDRTEIFLSIYLHIFIFVIQLIHNDFFGGIR